MTGRRIEIVQSLPPTPTEGLPLELMTGIMAVNLHAYARSVAPDPEGNPREPLTVLEIEHIARTTVLPLHTPDQESPQ